MKIYFYNTISTELFKLLHHPKPIIRASSILALGNMLGLATKENPRSVLVPDDSTMDFQQLIKKDLENMKTIINCCGYDGSLLVRRELLRTFVKFIYCPLHTYYISKILYGNNNNNSDNNGIIKLAERSEDDCNSYIYIANKFNELKSCISCFDLHSSYVMVDKTLKDKYNMSHRDVNKALHKDNTSLSLATAVDRSVKKSIKPITSESQIYKPYLSYNDINQLNPNHMMRIPPPPPLPPLIPSQLSQQQQQQQTSLFPMNTGNNTNTQSLNKQKSEPLFETERKSELLQALNDFKIPSTIFEVLLFYYFIIYLVEF